MFWDKIAGLYDLFENIYNKSVFQETGKTVAKYISSSDEIVSGRMSCDVAVIEVRKN